MSLDLSANVNALLGSNGSGKSNVYSAIAAFLSNKVITGTKRVSFLCEAFDDRAETDAYVEIVLDNSDRSLLIKGSGEIVFKRQFKYRKDVFRFQNKDVERLEFLLWLERVGFVVDSPFFHIDASTFDRFLYMSEYERLQTFQIAIGLESKYFGRTLLLKNKSALDDKFISLESTFEQLKQQLEEIESNEVLTGREVKLKRKLNCLRAALNRKTKETLKSNRDEYVEKYKRCRIELREVLNLLNDKDDAMQQAERNAKDFEEQKAQLNQVMQLHENVLKEKSLILESLKVENRKLKDKRTMIIKQVDELIDEYDAAEKMSKELEEQINRLIEKEKDLCEKASTFKTEIDDLKFKKNQITLIDSEYTPVEQIRRQIDSLKKELNESKRKTDLLESEQRKILTQVAEVEVVINVSPFLTLANCLKK